MLVAGLLNASQILGVENMSCPDAIMLEVD